MARSGSVPVKIDTLKASAEGGTKSSGIWDGNFATKVESGTTDPSKKLECLVALCRALLHPQLIEEKIWVKKNLKKKSCWKLPKLPENVMGGGGPAMDGQTDNRTTSHSGK